MGSVPTIDLTSVRAGRGLQETAAALVAAHESVGFSQIRGHGVPSGLVADAFDASGDFHALDQAAKDRVEINAQHRGYIRTDSSVTHTSTVDPIADAAQRHPNQSESFIVGREHPAGDADVLAGLPFAGPNPWPPELPELELTLQRYQRAMEELSQLLVSLFAVGLGAPLDSFAEAFATPTTFLRLLHYPPHPIDAPAQMYGSAPHSDHGFLTLLAQRGEAGLDVKTDDGWTPVLPVPDTFVLNTGDIATRWSNDRLRATPHRVINRSGTDRHSIAFFFDPHVSTMVDPLECCVSEERPKNFEPVNYGEYIWSRLSTNYVQHDSPSGSPRSVS